MAETGKTTIQHYRTATLAAVPSAGNLTNGELAINYNDADMALYAKNSSGSVKRVMNNPAGLKYPTADGTSGQVIRTDGSGVLSFASIITGNASVLTSNTTVTAGSVILASSDGGAFTVTLPASPASGDKVEVIRRGSNNVTIGRNGSTIEGSASDWVIEQDRLEVVFEYDGTTWRRFHPKRDPITDKGTVSSGTVTFNYANGKRQKLTVGGALTIALSGGVAGEFQEMFVQIVNGGSAVITWPTVTWMVGDGSSSATFSSMGVTLRSSGSNWVYFWTDGTTNFGKAI